MGQVILCEIYFEQQLYLKAIFIENILNCIKENKNDSTLIPLALIRK